MFLRLAAYTAITLLLAYPLSLHPGSHVMSVAPDTDLFLWTLSWDAHAFLARPFDIFDANIYSPRPLTLAYSENLIGSAMFAAPVLWLTGNPVLAMNAVGLLSAVLCALGAYWLARRVGATWEGAFVTGLVFAFTPPRFLRMDQMHLVAMQWMPFALATLHGYLDRGRRGDLWLTAAFVTLQVLSSGHGAVFLVIAAAMLFAWRVGTGSARLAWAMRLRAFGWPGALLIAPVVATLVPYFLVQRSMGLRRTLEDWAVPASSFLASPSHAQVALLSWFPDWQVNETAGAYLFPGVLPILLALSGALWPSRAPASPSRTDRGREATASHSPLTEPRIFYLLLTLLAVWLAAGPPYGLWPFVYWLPGLNFIRAPSRFVLLAVLGLAVLAGVGFDRLTWRSRRRRALVVVATIALVAEFAAVPLGSQPYRVEIPSIDRWLVTQPQPVVVAEVPLPDSRDLNRRERRQTMYMLHSTAHWHKTVHGYSGLRPPEHDDLYRSLLRFPNEESLSKLEAIGTTHVVVHADLYAPDEWQEVSARLATSTDRLRLLREEPGGRVYGLVRAGGRGGQ